MIVELSCPLSVKRSLSASTDGGMIKMLMISGKLFSTCLARRMKDAVNEMQHYDEFDYLVVNDDFDIALNELSTIIHSQRLNINQQSIKHQDLLKALIR
jgi:guanylate kinase